MLSTKDAAQFDRFLAEIRAAIVTGAPVAGGASIETESTRVEIRFEPIEKAAQK